MKKKLRICMVGHEFPPNVISGPGRYAINLVKYLLDSGHNVTFITPRVRGGKRHEKTGRLEVLRIRIASCKPLEKLIPNFLDTRIMFSLRLRSFFRNFDLSGFDLIHILDSHDSYFLSKRITEKLPVVVNVNDYYSLRASLNPLKKAYPSTDYMARYFYYNVVKFLDSKYIKRATLAISNSNYTTSVIQTALHIEPRRIKLVYKGVDRRMFSATDSPKEKYTNHKILFIGSNMERKGVIYLVRAMKNITEIHPDACLTIIGRTSFLYRRIIRGIVKKNSLQGNIRFIERLKPDDVQHYYTEANVFVLPALEEAFGQVILESMLSKTPVVATTAGGIPEIIIDGENGLLVEPRNPVAIGKSVIRLFDEPSLSKRLAESAFTTARGFSSSGMSENVVDTYFSAMEEFKKVDGKAG